VLKKKIWANFKELETFTQKIVNKLSKIWVWDPGVKKAPDPGSRIRIRNTRGTIQRTSGLMGDGNYFRREKCKSYVVICFLPIPFFEERKGDELVFWAQQCPNLSEQKALCCGSRS
jgi:hypothetical protein